MIELRDVSISAGEFQLSHIDLQIATGQYAVMMGQTGAGKTTLVETICGLRKISSGCIIVGDRDVTNLRPAERNTGYVPQDLALFPTMTVREHLTFAPRMRRPRTALTTAEVEAIAQQLDITHLLDRKPVNLSGGESQRVALGRALSFRPEALLLDEPLSALDETTRKSLQTLLRNINRDTGVTVLHVTHDSAEATTLADLVVRLHDGNLHTKPTS
ncbi:Maltose/maltodextrin import ATP-binding protein MalK [Rubripirellula tenax]|uniref:Maltose/maltodextrin import ATP-binding protein MalK n=1 Tax=Rubripirellula tenax TaxID=2528015 RepID=A0A5C6F5S0_9BACT|nr:ABC transporter ATP-binding protein [Rubripirellula tenax]TWU56575.1 Maltose/maltodextrin import ATP-binding protein MalK [Rubripirellula tenax]